MLDAWHANAATTGLTWDLAIAAIVLSVWIAAGTQLRRNRNALVAIPATFPIAESCGLPLCPILRRCPSG